jgi:hypothetical protein
MNNHLRLIHSTGDLHDAITHLDALLAEFANDHDTAVVNVTYIRRYLQSALAAYPHQETPDQP